MLFLSIRQLLYCWLVLSFFEGKLSGGYLASLLIPLKRLIWFLGTGAWDKVFEKIAASTYFLGLEFIINGKATLKVPTIHAIPPPAEPALAPALFSSKIPLQVLIILGD